MHNIRYIRFYNYNWIVTSAVGLLDSESIIGTIVGVLALVLLLLQIPVSKYRHYWNIRGKNCVPFVSTWIQLRLLMGSVLLIFLVLLCCVLWIVCLCPVSCVPNVSGLSILDCTSVFSNVYLCLSCICIFSIFQLV